MSKSNGFTLIELLIVIVIISVVATFAVLSINVNQSKRLESFSTQLVNTLNLAEQESMLRPATLGFVVTKNSFQFYEFIPTQKKDENPWHTINEKTLGKHLIPKNTKLTLKIQGEVVTSSTPKLIFTPSGDVTPFQIFIGEKSSTPIYKITGDESGTIKSERINNE